MKKIQKNKGKKKGSQWHECFISIHTIRCLAFLEENILPATKISKSPSSLHNEEQNVACKVHFCLEPQICPSVLICSWISETTQSNKKKIIICSFLTVPLLPMDRWLSCCVRGPIMEAGWMDMVCSIPDVRTAPCGKTHNDISIYRQGQTHCWWVEQNKAADLRWKTLTVGGIMYDWWWIQDGLCSCRNKEQLTVNIMACSYHHTSRQLVI